LARVWVAHPNGFYLISQCCFKFQNHSTPTLFSAISVGPIPHAKIQIDHSINSRFDLDDKQLHAYEAKCFPYTWFTAVVTHTDMQFCAFYAIILRLESDSCAVILLAYLSLGTCQCDSNSNLKGWRKTGALDAPSGTYAAVMRAI
jgi:hypothetical protein